MKQLLKWLVVVAVVFGLMFMVDLFGLGQTLKYLAIALITVIGLGTLLMVALAVTFGAIFARAGLGFVNMMLNRALGKDVPVE